MTSRVNEKSLEEKQRYHTTCDELPGLNKTIHSLIHTKIRNATEIPFCFTKDIHCIVFISHFIHGVDANLGIHYSLNRFL